MTEALDGTNGSQGQFLDISISSFRIKEVAAEIIYNMFNVIVICLNKNHADSGVGGSQVKSIVVMIVGRPQQWSRNKETLETLKRLLSSSIPMKSDISF